MLQCHDAPPEELLLAIRQFNSGQWYDCHETLEELWIGEEWELRDFYQGILQLAVALYHWRNDNYAGAISLLKSGIRLLKHVSDSCLGVDVARLIEDANQVREALEQLGAARMHELDLLLLPQVQMLNETGEP